MAYRLLVDGDAVLAPDVNQLLLALQGTTGSGQLMKLTALNDPANPILRIQNLDAGLSEALRILDNAGNDVLRVDKLGLHTALPATVDVGGEYNVRSAIYGAIGDDAHDDTVPIQTAVTAAGATGGKVIFPPGTYRTTAPIVFGLPLLPIHLVGPAIIHADHNGNCLDLSTADYHYSRHVVENLTLVGPDAVSPPLGYVFPSTGAGLRMAPSYGCVIRDVWVQRFKYGVYTTDAIQNTFTGSTYLQMNEYGLYMDGASNTNNINGIRIRQNRKIGVVIDGTGGAYKPTANVFTGVLVEANKPYFGGWVAPTPPTDGVGIYLKDTYYNLFTGLYLEDQAYHIWITGSADNNTFNGCYGQFLDANAGKVGIFGNNCLENSFESCSLIPEFVTDINFEVDAPGSSIENVLTNCNGFQFDPAIIDCLVINGLKPFRGFPTTGQRHGAITLPEYAVRLNIGAGTGAGTIEGMGTATATLHVGGFGEFGIGTGLTAKTVITVFDSMKKGQFLLLVNYQITHELTIRETNHITGSITLANNEEFTMRYYGDSILFYVARSGRAVEVSRNLVGVATIPTTGTWTKGERIVHNDPAAAQYGGWGCTTTGTFGAYAGGTATCDGTTTVVLTAVTGLKAGEWILINGAHTRQVISINIGALTIVVNTLVVAGGPGWAVAYVPCVLKGIALIEA